MDQLLAALDASWRILLIGIVLGAGLPTLFALGTRFLAKGWGKQIAGEISKPSRTGRVLAYAIFTVIVLMVLASIAYIAAHGLGYLITFDGIIPVFTHK